MLSDRARRRRKAAKEGNGSTVDNTRGKAGVSKEKYTQFHLAVKMKDKTIWTHMREKEFLKSVICNRKRDVYIWYLVASWACEVTVILT